MIIESLKINNRSIINYDICIVGSGAAGITIALQYLNTNKKVAILSGGGWNETFANRELNKGIIDSNHHHEPLEENRRRQFGGTTAAWGGRCIPFDSIDFEKRDWLTDCEWPFDEEEIKQYYDAALNICDAGKNNFDARSVFPNMGKEIIEGLDNEDISSWQLERWSPPVKFGERYKEVLLNSKNIDVFLDAHASNFNIAVEGNGKIESVDFSINSIKDKIKAEIFILSAGGIENPRLLLTSKSKIFPNGIGNQNDNVGRYYMSHLTGTFAIVKPLNRDKIILNFEKDADGVYCRRRWWISPKAQEKYKIGNSIFFLHRSLNGEGHRDSIFSSIYLAKTFLKVIKNRKRISIKAEWAESKSEIKQHLNIVLRDSPNLIPKLFNLAKMRFAKRRLPFILPSINSNQFCLYFQTEHLPNRNSRIYLSDKQDILGIPLPIVSIDFQTIDIETIVTAHKIFVDRFIEKEIGEIVFNEDKLREFLRIKIDNFNSSAHHLGTTRMSSDPQLGVIDKNCKVFETENLYIAGASVFPTGGHANPTLLIITLALRLADYLKTK